MSSNTGEPFQRINIDTAKEKIDSEECTIVDVRQQDEWDSGHVKNAIHIPVDEILSKIDQLPVKLWSNNSDEEIPKFAIFTV